MDLINCFDWVFYLKHYPLLRKQGISTKEQALSHWNRIGKNLNYICNLQSIKSNNLNIKELNSNNDSINKKIKNKNHFNILIRTFKSELNFKKCIDSILSQNYSNYTIYVAYDCLESYEYLQKYKKNSQINLIYINYYYGPNKFELYFNNLLDQVKEGWIIFLDDICKLSDNALVLINNNIKNEDNIIKWNYLEIDKLIKPDSKIIDYTYCFHINNKSIIKSDYIYLDSILTETVNNNYINKIGTPEPIITIVMTTVNRKNETLLTLKSFEKLYANRYNINVIIVDDNSSEDHKINSDINDFNFKITLIELKEKNWINPVVPFNIGLYHIPNNTEYVILQSAEVYHVSDIIEHMLYNVENKYLTYPVFSLPNFEYNNKLKNCHDNNENIIEFIEDIDYKKFNFDLEYYKNTYDECKNMNKKEAIDHYIKKGKKIGYRCNKDNCYYPNNVINDWKGWYNHYKYNNRALHFLSCFRYDLLNKIGGFCNKFKDGLWYDDDDFKYRISKVTKIENVVTDYYIGIHQYHEGGSSENRYYNDFNKLTSINKKILDENKNGCLIYQDPYINVKKNIIKNKFISYN